MITPRASARALLTALILVGLAGCSGPGGGSDNGGGGGGETIDPWLADDLEQDAAILTGNFMGVELVGYSCDVSQYFQADGDGDVRPYASVIVTVAGSSINYTEETFISTAQGSDLPPTGGMPATVTVTTTRGGWDIGDGGANSPWTPSADLAFTAVPVPEEGCPAADMWYFAMKDVGTDAAEIVRAFTEDGLKNVAGECPDAWFTWIPPNLTCEEYEALTG